MISVAMNDTAAFFAGKMFGRNKLIGISPNKTWEGFIGGLVLNIYWTHYWLQLMLFGEHRAFFTCGSQVYELAPFSNYECDTIHAVYTQRDYQVPLLPEGYNILHLMPAQIYACIFCVFAALIGPFAGFLASGMKRAYGIKDFATTFPGHGGFTDRFDCCSFACGFVGIMVTQVVFRDDYAVDQATKIFNVDLQKAQQLHIF